MSLMSKLPISSTRPMISNSIDQALSFLSDSCENKSKNHVKKILIPDDSESGYRIEYKTDWELGEGNFFKCVQSPSYDGTKKCECITTTTCNPGDDGCYPYSQDGCRSCTSMCNEDSCSTDRIGGSFADSEYCECKNSAGCGGLSGEDLRICLNKNLNEIVNCCKCKTYSVCEGLVGDELNECLIEHPEDTVDCSSGDQNVCVLDIASELAHGNICGSYTPQTDDISVDSSIKIEKSWDDEDKQQLEELFKEELESSIDIEEYDVVEISKCITGILTREFTPYQYKSQTDKVGEFTSLAIKSCLQRNDSSWNFNFYFALIIFMAIAFIIFKY